MSVAELPSTGSIVAEHAALRWEPWGDLDDGPATLFTATTADGATASFTDFGATLVALTAPDRNGAFGDVVLGHDALAPYTSPVTSPYFGSTIGRYANRIAGGRFTLDGIEHALDVNEGGNTLHGGTGGFHHRLWWAQPRLDDDAATVEFSYLSPDGEEGFPGELRVTASYTLRPGPVLTIQFRATTDAPTVVNLTNHAYWNLAGLGRAAQIDRHRVAIESASVTEVDRELIPTGRLVAVAGSEFDLRSPVELADRSFDHSFVLTGAVDDGGPAMAAVVLEPDAGRRLTVSTTEPAVHLYTGDAIGEITGKSGVIYGHEAGSASKPSTHRMLPTTALSLRPCFAPGETYTSTTRFEFDTV